ncbi:DNA recombination protein RmuC [Nocardia sp. 2YAB30]|uniref:DNA recombination protein RmuC n=1 Tax=unclassified Nocardia TaxID=2637762 RepID=UPI003F99C271
MSRSASSTFPGPTERSRQPRTRQADRKLEAAAYAPGRAKARQPPYLDTSATDDPDVRGELLTSHAEHLGAHVDQLADKAYRAACDPRARIRGACSCPAIRAADHRLGSAAVSVRPERDPRDASQLIAMLRMVVFGWRQEALSRDMKTVQRRGRELYQRLGMIGRHLERLGAQLGKACFQLHRCFRVVAIWSPHANSTPWK